MGVCVKEEHETWKVGGFNGEGLVAKRREVTWFSDYRGIHEKYSVVAVEWVC